MTAISPTISPALTVSRGLPAMVSATSPSAMKYMRLADLSEKTPPLEALSASSKSFWPAANCSSLPDAWNSFFATAAL